MGNILRIWPKLHQPLLTILYVRDQRNPDRWFFRDKQGKMQGPFYSKLSAQIELGKILGDIQPMRIPFQQDGAWWWRKDTPTGVQIKGPYATNGEAMDAIGIFLRELSEKAQ